MDQEYLIKKWLTDELTEAEAIAFDALDDAQLNKDIIKQASHFKAPDTAKIEDFEVFKKRYDASKTNTKTAFWKSPMFRIASVIVVALGIYYTLNFNNTTEIQTLASQKTTIELPDHSVVTLNAVSEIAFNEKSWKNNRSLQLEGEAYFKVAKGKTFDVVTTSGTVTVVGTEFNVLQRDGIFQVQCYEGVVTVVSDTLSRQLVAGDSFKIYKHQFSQSTIQGAKPQWTDYISTFDAIALKDVLSELERQYNIEITTKNVNLDKLFSGGFTHTNMNDALISITQPMNLSYTLNSSNRVVLYENKQ